MEVASQWGPGCRPSSIHLVDVSITSSAYIGGPVGDLRLVPDLDRMTVLHAMPGWAWAPVDRRTQDGKPYPECQRSFARPQWPRRPVPAST